MLVYVTTLIVSVLLRVSATPLQLIHDPFAKLLPKNLTAYPLIFDKSNGILDEFFFDDFMTYDEIVSGIEYYADKYTDLVNKITMNGKTYNGLDIVGAKIAAGTQQKPIVFLECGIHAREWIAPAVCAYFIHELATSGKHNQLLEKYEFHIYPSVNPDGYKYSFEEERFWRKNRKPSGNGCIGTDLNRNFDAGPFCGDVASEDPCDELFCGTAPFSEPESKAIRDTVLSLKSRISFYISFHCCGPMWMFPFSYKEDLPDHHDELLRKARVGADAIKRYSGTEYKVGTIANTIYPATGTTLDWIYEKAGIKNTYVLEINASGFELPPEEILPTCKETLVGIEAMLLE